MDTGLNCNYIQARLSCFLIQKQKVNYYLNDLQPTNAKIKKTMEEQENG